MTKINLKCIIIVFNLKYKHQSARFITVLIGITNDQVR